MFITAPDGTPIAVSGTELRFPRARVVITHGYAEHSGRYATLASELTAAGFETHAFDLRGHGHSGGVPAHVGHFGQYVDDLQLVIDYIRGRSHVAAPLIVLGHSLGGLIALYYARSRSGFEGLVISSPFLRPAFDIPPAKKALAWGASFIAPTLPFSNELNPEWLSSDEQVVDEYARDPLVRRTTTPRWFMEVQRAQQKLCESAASIRLPLLMLLGGSDPIADHRLAEEVFQAIGSEDKTIHKYEGLLHEVFNESERAVVVNDLIGWLRARF
jgi:alpha-beta hydrolase superfamily lysophospholipase